MPTASSRNRRYLEDIVAGAAMHLWAAAIDAVKVD
jgi:hypothetical protein